MIGSVTVGKPHNIAIHPNGRLAYVGSQAPGKFSLAIIDLMDRKLKDTVSLEKTRGDWNSARREVSYIITQAGIESVVVIDPREQ